MRAVDSTPVKLSRAGKSKGEVFYLHWNKKELEQRGAALRAAGHKVRLHWSTETTAKFGDDLPAVFVISLDRLPSHGRTYAEWLWEAKKRRYIPIVFAGGEADKVKVAKTQFPNAIFCATEEVPDVVTRILG